MKITSVDVDAGSAEEFASIILPYGQLGYTDVYTPEDFEESLILTTGEYKLDDEDLENAGHILREMVKGEFGVIELSNGKYVTLKKE